MADERTGGAGHGTRRRSPDEPCLNCGDVTPGRYCPECGQAKREVVVSVRAMVMDVLEDQLVLNSALPLTLLYLLFRPGRLTIEYINGRIVRYIAPFRLYLVTSVVFFLLLSFFGLQMIDRFTIDVPAELADGADSTHVGSVATMPALAALDTMDLPPEARGPVNALIAEVTRSAAQQGWRAASDSTGQGASDGLQPWARRLSINVGTNELNERVKARTLERFGHLPPGQAARQFVKEYSQYLPHMVFFLLPVFAFVLKLLYLRRRRFYAEHFVFALHVHAFVFLMFILMLAFRNTDVNVVLLAWACLYTWLAMKKVYGQGFFRTSLKYATLGIVYSTTLSFALAITVVVTLVLL